MFVFRGNFKFETGLLALFLTGTFPQPTPPPTSPPQKIYMYSMTVLRENVVFLKVTLIFIFLNL